jgi:carbon-monoxide dehydrogenase medium subunit
MRRFTIVEPTSLEEVCSLLAEHENAAVYAGGTELLLAMKQGFIHYERLVDIKDIAELRRLEVDLDRGVVRAGAAVTHRGLEKGVRGAFPLLADIVSKIGNIRVRNVGTVGGNLCFAEPASDVGVIGMLLGGRLSLVRSGARRTVDLAAFFVDAYETVLQRGEVLEHLELDIPKDSVGLGYERLKLKERPLVAGGVSLGIDGSRRVVEDARVVVGAVSPTPAQLERASDALRGVALGELHEAAEDAARTAAKEVDVVGDLEASERYRRHVTGVVVKRGCLRAAEDWIMRGGGA